MKLVLNKNENNVPSFELDNGTHNLKSFPGVVEITNRSTHQCVCLAVEDGETLSELCDVIFNRD